MRPIQALLLLVLSSSTQISAAVADAQLVIYIETISESAMPVRLDLADLTLAGEPEDMSLTLDRGSLSTTDLAGVQFRLVDQPVTPGRYHHLRLGLSGVETYVGQAAVKPELPENGVEIPVDLEIRSGECALLILRWRPRVPPEKGPHVPEISVHHPEVPPLGSLAFVTNEESGTITVIDQTTGRVVDCILVGAEPRDLAYSPVDRMLYVAVAGDDALVVLEASSRQRLQTLQLRFGDEPSRLLLVNEDNRLYVLNRGTDVVTVLSIPSLQEMGRIPVGPGPRSLVRDDRTGYIYIASETSGEILVYDPLSASVVTSLAIDSTPAELAFDSNQRQLHVASGMRRRVITLDVDAGEITAQVNLCAQAEGLVFEPVSRRLYAATGRCRQLTVLQPIAGMEIRGIKLEDEPGLLAVSADRRRILVTLPLADRLAICNVNSARVESVVETGRRPYAVVTP